jgi:cytidine deaminase
MISEEKSHGFGFDYNSNSTVTVLVTTDGEVFKANNGNVIKDGKLVNTCSEQEAVTAMMKANKTRIDYLVTLDMENADFIKPCKDCINLILQINPENAQCNVMVSEKETSTIETLASSVKSIEVDTTSDINDFDSWLDGWDDDVSGVGANTTATNLNQQSVQVPPTSDGLAFPKQSQSLLFEDNPMPNQPTNNSSTQSKTSSYYQSKYLNTTPASSNVSVTFKQPETITSRMRQNGLSDSDKKDFNKQRLYNAFTVENVLNVNGAQDTDTTVQIAEKQTLSKKELIKLAKEKKRMAKRDAKILEASNKKK